MLKLTESVHITYMNNSSLYLCTVDKRAYNYRISLYGVHIFHTKAGKPLFKKTTSWCFPIWKENLAQQK